jgi:hypothetical protein
MTRQSEGKQHRTKRAMRPALTLMLMLVLRPLLAVADPTEFFSAGSPDGLIGTQSRPEEPAAPEAESADDVLLSGDTEITGATFTGLVPVGATVSSVDVEIYRVFPLDSTNPPSGQVPTRLNSPAARGPELPFQRVEPGLFGREHRDQRNSTDAQSIHGRRRRGQRPGSEILGKLHAFDHAADESLVLCSPGEAQRRRLPMAIGAEADRRARHFLHSRFADLDPQHEPGTRLAAGRHGHHGPGAI